MTDIPDTPACLLHPPFLDDPALRAVLAALPGTRIVGGAVRDALAGRPVADIDLATPLPPAEVTAALARAGLKSAPTGLAHGTVTAIACHRGFEVTTLRRDLATDGRHAVVAFGADWREDAARRDFTINALSLAPTGEVFDYFGGIADLRAGRVRFVGPAARRIAEDTLRILRYFRFHARYGTGAPDPEALAAIAAARAGLAHLSAERVWSELKRLLATPRPAPALALMEKTSVLPEVLPDSTPARLAALLAAGLPPDPVLRLAALSAAPPAALAARLRLSGAESATLAALSADTPPVPPADAPDDDLRRALALMPGTLPAGSPAPGPLLAGRAWLAGRPPAFAEALRSREAPLFPLRGRDLRAAGMAPGPELGHLLEQVRAWWLATGCHADTAACLAEARRLRG